MDSSKMLTELEAHLSNTQAKLYYPDDPEYTKLQVCFIDKPIQTLAIVRPQTAEDVSSILQFCLKNDVDFCVRTGGHDCASRTLVKGALVIDMRDIKHVTISDDKQTARVGGGILSGELCEILGKEGLTTPVGTIGSVGYTGWATLGGYGPLTSHYGMGVDQILAAKIVNANGEIQDADADMLVGIRGGGGSLGIIVELTIKVYPIGTILFSTIIFESSDLPTTLTSYTNYYESLLKTNQFPIHLQLQPFILEIPNLGTVLMIGATWHGDKEEGHAWIKNIASAAPCVMQSTEETTMAALLEKNDKAFAGPFLGRVFTVSFKTLTEKTISILSKYSANAPGGGAMFAYHTLLSTQEPVKSVLGTRARHHMLEIYALTKDKDVAEQREKWGREVKAELEREDGDNVLEGSYVSLGEHGEDLKRVYGRHYETLLGLKRRFDPENVFKHSIPRLVIADQKIVEAE
ncbi:6-hydroxy-d-nicotine oxidase [Fusarium flagelliforme]|uniref:6-hydroxy-d-nicotine oxidase n=1 Tax=Fusarium flagelliforme TaxID=2675880 RepID=A0A395MC54_9HYPO|nr:6-hydroxy-d-nicotine oxidase [Fusarium flagelliforme]